MAFGDPWGACDVQPSRSGTTAMDEGHPRATQILLLPFSLTKGADLDARMPVVTPAASALFDAAAPGKVLWGLAVPAGERLWLKAGKALTVKPFFSEMISRQGGEMLALTVPRLSSGAAAGGWQVTGGPLASLQGESS